MVFVAAGCTIRLTDFTMISTKNIELARAATFKRAANRTRGKDTTYIIVAVPTGQPNMKEAIDRAIESVPGAIALVDGVIYSTSWYIPMIYGENSYVVEGTPLIDPSIIGGK
jgi:hypothetical protein